MPVGSEEFYRSFVQPKSRNTKDEDAALLALMSENRKSSLDRQTRSNEMNAAQIARMGEIVSDGIKGASDAWYEGKDRVEKQRQTGVKEKLDQDKFTSEESYRTEQTNLERAKLDRQKEIDQIDARLKEAQIKNINSEAGARDKKSEAAGKGLDEDALKRGGDLRKEYGGKDVTKNTYSTMQSYEKINRALTSTNPTPADDITAVYNFMKMQDPGSTVREGEYATAQNAGSVDARIREAYNNALKGNKLTTEQRSQFLNSATSTLDAQLEQQRALDDYYSGLAREQYRVDPSTVVDPNFGTMRGKRKQATDELAAKQKEVNFNPAGKPGEGGTAMAGPYAPIQAPGGRQVIPGSTIVDKATGEVYTIGPNGELVPVKK